MTFILEMLALMGGYILLMKLPEKPARWIIFIILFVVIVYCDNGGIRAEIVKKLPKNFPFHKKLAKKRKSGDVLSERYKTIVCFCLLYRWNIRFLDRIAIILAIIFTGILLYRYLKYNDKVFFGMINDDTFSPVTSALLISGACFLFWSIENCDYNTYFWMLWIGISLVIIIAFFKLTNEYKKKKSVALAFI